MYNKIMNGTRHEEYAHISNNLPFILHPRLHRTPSTCRAEKNWHENIEIQVCLDGEGYVLLDGDKHDFKKGDIILVNSNAIHYTYTNTSLIYTCIIVDTEFCKQVDVNYSSLNLKSKINSESIMCLTEKLTNIYLDENYSCRVARLTQIILQILIEIVEKHVISFSEVKTKPRSYERVKLAIKYVRENYTRKLSLEEIAKNVYADKFVLSREFKKITGQTVINYVNLYRCQKAIELIESGENVIEASYKCGFENPSFFSKTFKKHLGVSPSKYKYIEN